MQKNTIQLTQAGYDEIQKEYDELVAKRPEVVKELDHMRSLGDLKENNAYDQLKAELGFLEGRIKELEEILKVAVVIDTPTGDKIKLGSKVALHIEGDRVNYQLVDETEADITSGKISSSSPIGAALLGRKIGDEVQVESPSGTISYQILEIE